MGHGGFGGRGIAINRDGFGHGRFEGRRALVEAFMLIAIRTTTRTAVTGIS
jgi:hypothetical protein